MREVELVLVVEPALQSDDMAVRWPEVQKRTITSPIPRKMTRLREPGIHFPPRTAEMRPDAPVAPFLATTTMIRTPTAMMRRPQRFISSLS
jgi:hypothetical protein